MKFLTGCGGGTSTKSLPSRERGLKYLFYPTVHLYENVAPFAGAWIEILSDFKDGTVFDVAPFAGAWIEIVSDGLSGFAGWSLPSRERGLKFISLAAIAVMVLVAPFAGAWIEIA